MATSKELVQTLPEEVARLGSIQGVDLESISFTSLLSATPVLTNWPSTRTVSVADDFQSTAFREKLLSHFQTARNQAIAKLASPSE